jgi:hypothetical protein
MDRVLGETVIGQAEAARLLRCSPEAVGQLVREGDAGGNRLEADQVRGHWVTSVEAVYRFANRCCGPHHGRGGTSPGPGRPPAPSRGAGGPEPAAPGWVCALFLGPESPAAVGAAVAGHPLFGGLFEQPWRRGLLAFARSLPPGFLATLATAAAGDALAERGVRDGVVRSSAARAGAAFLRHLNRRLLGAKTRADAAAREASVVPAARP